MCVLGFHRPTIVISRDVLTVLGDQELRAVLAHEVAHMRQGDYLLNWLLVVLRSALFYLPPWPVASETLAEVREHRADRLSVGYTADPLALASALVKVWRHTPPRPAAVGAVGMLARHGRLEARIRRLLEPTPPRRPFWRTLVAGVALAGGLLLAQTTVEGGTHLLARASPAIADWEACCDPEVSPFPHCVPPRRVFCQILLPYVVPPRGVGFGLEEPPPPSRVVMRVVQPLAVFQRQLGQTPTIFAYPYGSHDEAVLGHVKQPGYVAAFDVRRQGNPSFVPVLTMHRSQIYADMTLEDFAKNLNVFHEEPSR
ncbi:MAG: M56 family metallopeptidase [Candidatus Rokuibacteriota bacterium]